MKATKIQKKVVRLLVKKSKEKYNSKPRIYGDLEKTDMEKIKKLTKKILKKEGKKVSFKKDN